MGRVTAEGRMTNAENYTLPLRGSSDSEGRASDSLAAQIRTFFHSVPSVNSVVQTAIQNTASRYSNPNPKRERGIGLAHAF